MSIKIYTGFRFKSSDLPTIFGFIQEWRSTMGDLHKRAVSEVISEIATEYHDDTIYISGRSGDFKSPIGHAWHEVKRRVAEIKKTGYRDPLVDFDFDIDLFPFEGNVYGMLRTDRPDWRKQFLKQPMIEDFAYWNSTDPEKGMSKSEWANRARVWDAIFKKSGIIQDVSLEAKCGQMVMMPAIEKLLDAAPSFEKRVRRVAEFQLLNEDMESLDISVDEAFMHISKYMSWLKSDEAEPLVQKKIEEVSIQMESTKILSEALFKEEIKIAHEQTHQPTDSALDELRHDAADQEFQNYIFGDAHATQASGWEYTSPGREMTRPVWLIGENPDTEANDETIEFQATFTVVFTDNNSAEIESAYATVNGNDYGCRGGVVGPKP